MRIIFNSYNTIGAGTSNISKFILKSLSQKKKSHKIYFIIPNIILFNGLESNENLKIIRLPAFQGYLKYAFRFLYDFFLLPAASFILKSSAVVVLANYSPMIVRGKKIVFMRHLFLVDDCSHLYDNSKNYIIEKIRKLIFSLTLKTTDIIIVQRSRMKEALLSRYGKVMPKIVIMPNPVSNLMDRSKIANTHITDNYVLYVSRYYPHKQHIFLLQMVDRYKTVLRKKRIKFYITVDKNTADMDARNFLNKISKYNLDDIIYNLGEITNDKLTLYYGAAKCFFFPSTSETFGNPLLEAMSFELPIIVPNLDYAKDVCRDAGIYYEFNKIDDAFDKIISLLKNGSMQEEFSRRSRLRFKYFSTTDEWVDDILSLVP